VKRVCNQRKAKARRSDLNGVIPSFLEERCVGLLGYVLCQKFQRACHIYWKELLSCEQQSIRCGDTAFVLNYESSLKAQQSIHVIALVDPSFCVSDSTAVTLGTCATLKV